MSSIEEWLYSATLTLLAAQTVQAENGTPLHHSAGIYEDGKEETLNKGQQQF